jgi:hypothetical protein
VGGRVLEVLSEPLLVEGVGHVEEEEEQGEDRRELCDGDEAGADI